DAGKMAPEVDAGEALDNGGQDYQVSRSKDGSLFQQDRQTEHNNSTNDINVVSSPVSTVRPSFVNAASQIPLSATRPSANDTRIFVNAYEDDVLEEEVDINNVDSSYAIPEATKNKKDERGIVIKNKARLVNQGHTQEEGIDYNEVFAPVKELSTEFEKLMHNKFQMSSMGELSFFLGLQVKQKSDGIFISQDKYVAEILKKFDFVIVIIASTLMESNKSLIKDKEAEDVDVHLYISMIGSLMYLTSSRPDITFAVCACASLDRKSTTGGCQFLSKRLISWQCMKQTIVANSKTEAEYVATTNCCGQVL
nr:hypothetical protein [Tanacetum cinerariifolium]